MQKEMCINPMMTFFFGTGAFNYSHHNDSVKLEALGDVQSWSVEDSLLILL